MLAGLCVPTPAAGQRVDGVEDTLEGQLLRCAEGATDPPDNPQKNF